MRLIISTAILFTCAAPLFSQQWELGAVGGYGFRPNISVQQAGQSASLNVQSGPVFGFYGGETEHGYLGGEAHYLYEQTNFKISGNGSEATTSGRSQVVHFDFLIHTAPEEATLRPYVAIGGGVKIFEGTGMDRAAQPLSNFVMLTRTRETKPVLTAAVGLKKRISRHVLVRAELRYFASPRPEKVLTPGPSAAMSGWIHDIAPMLGVAATF